MANQDAKALKCLVIGAAGFVGRHLVPQLHARGYIVTELDPKSHDLMSRRKFEKWALLQYDYPSATQDTFDLVVHLGANIKNIDARMHQGISAFEDLLLDYEVCKWVELTKPKCFIAMSSCAVDYPEDPYCIVKRTLEAMCLMLHKQSINVKILRPFSGYGYDQTLQYPFPSILKRAVELQDPLTVWGGTQVRDWLHIEDLVEGILYSIDNFPSGQPVELGLCKGINFIGLAALIASAVNKSIADNAEANTLYEDYSPVIKGDLSKASSSNYRVAGSNSDVPIGQHFGWVPKISLEEGIRIELDKLFIFDVTTR